MPVAQQIAYGVLAVIVIFLAVRLFMLPLKFGVRFMLNIAVGFVILVLFNLIGGGLHMTIGINFITVATVAALGMPGFALLLLVQALF